MTTLADAFWSNVVKTDTCWIWAGPKKGRGYGGFNIPGSTSSTVAHRWAYADANGPIPQGVVIDHTCHVRLCVNPAHLQAATPLANNQNRKGANKSNRTGVRGVVLDPRTGRYYVRVVHMRKRHWGGGFSDIHEAEAAAIALRNTLMTNNLLDRQVEHK